MAHAPSFSRDLAPAIRIHKPAQTGTSSWQRFLDAVDRLSLDEPSKASAAYGYAFRTQSLPKASLDLFAALKLHTSSMASSVKQRALSKGAQSRARVIAAAASLFQRRGYNGTGLSEIIKASATPKGSLYFHFPGGKEELTIAALEESGAEFGDKLRLLIRPETAPGEALEIASLALASELVESSFEKGCPLATVTLEAAANSEPIRKTCEAQFRGWNELIEVGLVARGMAPAQAEDCALTALSALEGAMLLCRAYKSTEPLEKVGKQLRRMVEMLLACQDAK